MLFIKTLKKWTKIILGTKSINPKASLIPHDFTVFCHSLHFGLLMSTLCGVEALWNGAALPLLCKDIAVMMEV